MCSTRFFHKLKEIAFNGKAYKYIENNRAGVTNCKKYTYAKVLIKDLKNAI